MKAKDTRPFAIVENGLITWQGQGIPMDKFQLVCKRNFRDMVWGDHCTMKKVKKDPQYVVFRSNGSAIRCVMVNLETAPDTWLNDIRALYWKDFTFAS